MKFINNFILNYYIKKYIINIKRILKIKLFIKFMLINGYDKNILYILYYIYQLRKYYTKNIIN